VNEILRGHDAPAVHKKRMVVHHPFLSALLIMPEKLPQIPSQSLPAS
jgi:hypothetical protein